MKQGIAVPVRVDGQVVMLNDRRGDPMMPAIRTFLRVGRGAHEVCSVRRMYDFYLGRIAALGVDGAVQGYRVVRTAPDADGDVDTFQNLDGERLVMTDGLRLLEDGTGTRLAVRTMWEMRTERFLVVVHCRRDELGIASAFMDRIARAMHELRGVVVNADGMRVRADRRYTWDDLVASEKVVNGLRQFVEMPLVRHAEFRRRGVPLKRGALLYGPPGNGKTLTCRILAESCGVNVVYGTFKDLSPFRHNIVSRVYELARTLSPALVVWEDIDLIAAERDLTGGSCLLVELLNELDGFERNHDVVTVATTNRDEVLDQAIANRPGRFDLKVRFANPDAVSRLRMLRLFCQRYAVDDNVNFEEIAAQLDGCSGAHVYEAVQRSVIRAMERGDFAGEKVRVTKDALAAAVAELRRKESSVGFERYKG